MENTTEEEQTLAESLIEQALNYELFSDTLLEDAIEAHEFEKMDTDKMCVAALVDIAQQLQVLNLLLYNGIMRHYDE